MNAFIEQFRHLTHTADGEDKDVYILYDQFGRMEPDQIVVVDSEELAESTCTKVGDLLILAG